MTAGSLIAERRWFVGKIGDPGRTLIQPETANEINDRRRDTSTVSGPFQVNGLENRSGHRTTAEILSFPTRPAHQVPRRSANKRSPRSNAELIWFCIQRIDLLNTDESHFVHSLARITARQGFIDLYPKQWGWLKSIVDRLEVSHV